MFLFFLSPSQCISNSGEGERERIYELRIHTEWNQTFWWHKKCFEVINGWIKKKMKKKSRSGQIIILMIRMTINRAGEQKRKIKEKKRSVVSKILHMALFKYPEYLLLAVFCCCKIWLSIYLRAYAFLHHVMKLCCINSCVLYTKWSTNC